MAFKLRKGKQKFSNILIGEFFTFDKFSDCLFLKISTSISITIYPDGTNSLLLNEIGNKLSGNDDVQIVFIKDAVFEEK